MKTFVIAVLLFAIGGMSFVVAEYAPGESPQNQKTGNEKADDVDEDLEYYNNAIRMSRQVDLDLDE